MRAVWENQICLNAAHEGELRSLGPAADYRHEKPQRIQVEGVDLSEALRRDPYPLPSTADREGYYGDDHFAYWLSGLRDYANIVSICSDLQCPIDSIFDFGCASGRLLRHFACQSEGVRVMGADINYAHIRWIYRYLPPSIEAFHSHSVPVLPIADASLSVVSAFSVSLISRRSTSPGSWRSAAS